jgi:hypothetical protein
MTSSEEFRQFGKAMIDYVADYLDNIRDRKVLPQVKLAQYWDIAIFAIFCLLSIHFKKLFFI